MKIGTLGLLGFVVGCGAAPRPLPTPTPAPRETAAVASARDPLVLLEGSEALRDVKWIGGERVAALSDGHVWIFDPRRPTAALVHTVSPGSWLATNPATDVFVVNSPAGKLQIFRGAALLRTLEDPTNAETVEAIGADGKRLVLRRAGGAQRIYDVEADREGGDLPDDFVDLDPTGQLVLTRSGVYDTPERQLVPGSRRALHALGTGQVGGWIEGTAFAFDETGVTSFEVTSRRTKRIALPCLTDGFTDQVDGANRRLVRACGNRIYVVDWPAGTIQRIRMPEPLKANPPRWELLPALVGGGLHAIGQDVVGGLDVFGIEAGRFVQLPAVGGELACSTWFRGARLDRAVYCNGAVHPNGTLVLAQVQGGFRVADLARDEELAVFGAADFAPGDQPYPRAGLGLDVAVAGATRYRFESTYSTAAPPQSEAQCGAQPRVAEWLRPSATLYRRADATQCLCTSASCTSLPADLLVLDARARTMLVAASFLDDKTQLRLDGRSFELLGACPYAALGDASALLLCQSTGQPFVAREVGLADLRELGSQQLPLRLAPTSIAPFRGGVLILSAGPQVALSYGVCQSVNCTEATSYFGPQFGILRTPNGVEIAGDAKRAGRALWCIEPKPAAEFSPARSYEACAPSSARAAGAHVQR